MLEKIEGSFRDIISALQTARLYSNWHPEFKKSVNKAYATLQDVLSQRQSLVIGIVGEELAFEKEIFFELSKMVKPAVLYLKSRGIERIEFLQGLENEELSKFITFLTTPKEELKHEPQEALSLLGIRNIIVGKIKVSSVSSNGKVEKAISYLNLYENSLDSFTGSLEKVLNAQELDHLALRSAVNNVMENLLGRYQEFLNFATLKRYDLRTFSHIINVSILSMYFSSRIGFAKDEILDIGTAALFHDIGKLYISRKILQKPARLTEEEFSKVKDHVVTGAEILLKYVDALGVLPVVVCFEHHLKYNLSGYPKVSFYEKPHIVSTIVSICDVYDALSQRRGYKSDYPPKMIYDLMTREKGTAFEPQLVDKFFKIMGVWPVGTLVVLSDGRIAVVREEDEEDIFSPKVEVISPQDKRETVNLKLAAEKNKIEHSLNPFTEGKEFLPLI
ncbi:MAG: HD domain-containing protein [Candidatus Omnitrophota bacterium]